MHIPDSMLYGHVCPVSAVIAATGLGVAAVYASSAREKPGIGRFAAVSALVFAGQMVNFPVADGTSGHLLGGVLAAALLGTPFGVLSIAMVVAVQALLFSDGGLLALGANVLNMAVVGAGCGGLLYAHWTRALPWRSPLRATTLAASCWISVMLAALGASIELALSGTIPFARVAPAMLMTHSVIGLGEGAIAMVLFALFSMDASRRALDRGALAALVPALATALVLAPFACGWPDGLEWVAGKLGFLRDAVPMGLLADYAIPFVKDEFASTALAGCFGVVFSFGMPRLLFGCLSKAQGTRRFFFRRRSRASAA